MLLFRKAPPFLLVITCVFTSHILVAAQGNKAQTSNSTNHQQQTLVIERPAVTAEQQRYFVQLKKPSLSQQKQKIAAQVTKQLQYQTSTSSNKLTAVYQQQLKAAYSSYTDALLSQQQSVLMSLTTATNHKLLPVRQHSLLLNGFALETSAKNASLLRKHPLVKAVHKSVRVKANLEQSAKIISAPQVWQKKDNKGQALTGSGVTVAIIDTGIDYNHPDLGGCFGQGCKVVAGYDFVNDDDDPMDDHEHGTHVAGIVAADGKLTGVAPSARLLAVKVLDAGGSGWDDQIIAGIEYAIDPDGDPSTDDTADVLNLSLGGSGTADSPMSIAVNNAVDAGAVVVVAAGNSGGYGDTYSASPASASKVISVASTTKDDQLSFFSSKGVSHNSVHTKPEIAAPGSDINSTLPNEQYAQFSGTSMAAPHVAGAAALLRQNYPNLSQQQITAKLITATQSLLDIDPFSQGKGRLDINQALDAQIVLHQAGIDFGSLDITADTISQRRMTLEIENLSNNNKQIQIQLPKNLPPQIKLSSQLNEFVLPANSKKAVQFTLSAENTAEVPVPDNPSLAYFDYINFVEGENQYQAAVAFNLRHKLAIELKNADSASVMIIDADTFRVVYNNWIGGNASASLAPGRYHIISNYAFFNDEFMDKRLPPTPEGVQIRQEGFETFTVNVDKDLQLLLDGANLAHLYGPDSVTDSQDSASVIKTSELYSTTMVMLGNKTLPFEFALRTIMPSQDNSYTYILVGQLSDEITTMLRQTYMQSGEVNTYIDNIQSLNATNLQGSRPSLNNLADKTRLRVSKTNDSALSNAQWQIDTAHIKGETDYHMPGADNWRLESAKPESEFFYYNLGNAPSEIQLFDPLQYQVLTHTPALFFDKNAYDTYASENRVLITPNEHYQLGIYGFYFSTNFEGYSRAIYHAAPKPIFSTQAGTKLFLYDLFSSNTLNKQINYVVSCNGKTQKQGHMQSYTLELPLCSSNREIQFEIENNWHGVTSQSTLRAQFNPDDKQQTIRGLSRFEISQQGQRVFNQTLKPVDTELKFSLVFSDIEPVTDVETFSVEIKSATGQWKKVAARGSDNLYKAILPASYLSKGLASLRISYTSGTDSTTQLLNNFLYIQ